MRTLASVVALLSLAGTVMVAQTPATPPARMPASAAFDAARGELVVVGEVPNGTATWIWNGSSWREFGGQGPSAREEPAMAYDAARGRVVLFGGGAGLDRLADTWEWDGTEWSQVATVGPPGRVGGAMVYDSRRSRMILFGGSRAGEGGPPLNDVWAWDGRAWSELIPDGAAGSPSRRVLHAMGYDPIRDRVVVVGGALVENGQPMVFGDTWEFDGVRWSEHHSTAGPDARDHVWMSWDGAAQQLLLHGGAHPASGLKGDSWHFDGTRWTVLTRDGPPRARHRMEWDDARRAIVLYGGWGPGQRVNEVWYLRGDQWQMATPR